MGRNKLHFCLLYLRYSPLLINLSLKVPATMFAHGNSGSQLDACDFIPPLWDSPSSKTHSHGLPFFSLSKSLHPNLFTCSSRQCVFFFSQLSWRQKPHLRLDLLSGTPIPLYIESLFMSFLR